MGSDILRDESVLMGESPVQIKEPALQAKK